VLTLPSVLPDPAYRTSMRPPRHQYVRVRLTIVGIRYALAVVVAKGQA
jgi:hypothetical protein